MAEERILLGRKNQKVSLLVVVLNFFLFCMKGAGALIFGSVALLSDAINSLGDTLASAVVLVSVRESAKGADRCHPYGHYRAEPLAAFVVAVLTAVFGFEVIKIAIEKIGAGGATIIAGPVIVILSVAIAIKAVMWFMAQKTGKKGKSIALLATAIDCRNDIIVDVFAIIGVYLTTLGYPLLDPLVGFFIGIYVLKSAFDIASKNIPYLTGRSPPEEALKEIKARAASVKGVKEVREIKAQYIGNYVQVEVHVAVDRKKSLENAHEIGHMVEERVMELASITNCTAHIDPA
jgi:cation diffusion facilitator family transporter